MFVATATKTMQGARQIVQDNEPHRIPRGRAALIAMSTRWREAQAPETAAPVATAKFKPSMGKGMPEWAVGIIRKVALDRGIEPEAIVSRSRLVVHVMARNEAFYRIRQAISPITGMRASYPMIGAWFGRDHTGPLWGAARHAQMNGLPAISHLNVVGKMAKARERHRKVQA